MFRLKNCIDKTREISKNALAQKRARAAALSLTTLLLALTLAAPASAQSSNGIYKLIATIPLASEGDAMTIDEKRGKLYTSVALNNNMAVVDLATNTVSKYIPFSGSSGYSIAQDPVLGKVLEVGSAISIFDMATETLTATVKPPAGSTLSVSGIAVNPLKGQYYVGLSYASYSVIAIYDEKSNNIVRQIKIPYVPYAMAVDPYRDQLYVLPGPNGGLQPVLAIDLVSDTIGATIPIPENVAYGIKIDIYHGLVYVGGRSFNTPTVSVSVPGNVLVIDEDTNALTQEIITSPFPAAATGTEDALTVQVAIDPVNGIGYTTNWFFKSVDIFDLRTNELIDTITINDQVWGLVVDPIRRTVYASSSTNLYVISAGPAAATPYSTLAVDFPT